MCALTVAGVAMQHGSTRAPGLVAFVAASAIAGSPTTGTDSNPAARECVSESTAWDREVAVRYRYTHSTSINNQRLIGIVKGRLARGELPEFRGTLISLNSPGATDIGLVLEPESYPAQHEARRAWVEGGTVYVYVENRKAPDVTRGVVIQHKVITWDGPEWNDLCYGRPARYVSDVAEELKTEGVFSAKVPWPSNSDHLRNSLMVIGTY
jgi:hypothetical protein